MIEDDLYRKILSNIPIACVDILVQQPQRGVLLLRRKEQPMADEWWFPGGRVMKGEAFGQAAARKVREECGFEIRLGEMLQHYETTFPVGRYGDPVHSIMLCFSAEPLVPDPDVTLDENHSVYKWVDHIPEGAHEYIRMCMTKAGYEAE